MTLLIVYGVFAIGVSFLCSILEACLLSLPASYVESMVQQGSRTGKMMQVMKENIDRPLAAILTLNTVAHTAGATGVGAQAANAWGSAAVGIASAVMTLLILVLSEIIPKTLGAVYAKSLAGPSALIIRGIIILCLPVIVPLEWMSRLFGWQRVTEPMSRAELLATIQLGRSSGIVGQREFRIASNVMRLSNIRLADVLTPRTVVFSLPAASTVGEVLDAHYPLRYARIPVYQDDPDHLVGYVPRYALYRADADGNRDHTLEQLVCPAPVLPELATVGKAMSMMLPERQHMGIVVDEYGSFEGIVTLEDLLETLLGEEIVDETDISDDMQDLARQRRKTPE